VVIKEDIQGNDEVKELVWKVQDGEALGPWQYMEGLLLYNDRIFLADQFSLIPTIIEQIHVGFHEGYHKTFQRIRASFYWRSMWRCIKEFVKECDVCQHHKVESLTPKGLLQPLTIP
jgi:hypothetical protein